MNCLQWMKREEKNAETIIRYSHELTSFNFNYDWTNANAVSERIIKINEAIAQRASHEM